MQVDRHGKRCSKITIFGLRSRCLSICSNGDLSILFLPLHPNRILCIGIACANNVVEFIVLKVANGTVADLGRFSVINMQITEIIP